MIFYKILKIMIITMYDLHKYLILSYLLFYKKKVILYYMLRKSYIVVGFVRVNIFFWISLTLAQRSKATIKITHLTLL